MSLHHVEINVSDLHKSLLFWQSILLEVGYSSYQKWDGGQSFIKDDCYLVFVQTEKKFLNKIFHRKHTGLNHLAFSIDDRVSFENLVENLIGQGYTLLYPEKHPFAGGDDYCAAYFEDPDRIKVEFVLKIN